jgi:hypothetical protein
MCSARLPSVAKDWRQARQAQNWGEMGRRKKFVVASAVAVCAMTAAAHPAEAPQLDQKNPSYSSEHKIVPAPVMGVRGEAGVLAPPVHS